MALTLADKPWYWGAGIGLVVAILVLVGTHMYLVTPINEKIHADETQIADLDKKIEQGRAAERKLPQFRAEVDRLKVELEKLRRILPSTKNTEEIIQKIKQLVDQGDFTLRQLTFPQPGGKKAPAPAATSSAATTTTGTAATTTTNVQQTLQEILEEPTSADNYRYDPQGRRDPFQSLIGPRPTLQAGQRPPGVPGFLIDEIKLTGVFRRKQELVGMITGPDNKSHLIR